MNTNPRRTGRLAPSIRLAPPASPSRISLSSGRHTFVALGAALTLLSPLAAHADDAPSGISTWTGAIVDEVRDVATQGASDLYVPLHTHHLRFAYTSEKIAQYNENPWGLGYGRVLSDGNKGSRMLYAMAFKDSHNDWSPMAGYGRIWNIANAGPVRFGLGYTVFLMSRSDTLGGVPFPGALPLAEIGVGRASVSTTYVPGGKGNGNVLFFFGRYTFGKPG
ncbi:lipid IV(A) palmitoyltransferase PagP [Pandoraea sp. XY-2]|uniref:lipid IV(A) palmitoyltransferase PagP n=1 Tax=Pandoraea sp. XY-2 TaxID=2518599 RepID=UPI00101B0076|nr:lipid IV(A) palmitoyltransferase PagP [Pandoraea sp. XY-2]QBC31118.1 phospholipid:lipid A palmitoyltransferase [Pandoraea sp. XY-2]